jgi:hypothetical protein
MQVNSTSTYSFPSNVRDSQKDADWHRACLDSLVTRSFDSNYSSQFAAIDQCYKYFDSGSNPQDHRYLMELSDGSTLPAQWQTINIIFNKIMVLLGELMERGYDFEVTAINKEAKSRKLEAKEDARVMMRLAPLLQEIDQYGGIQAQMPELPEDPSEFDEFFDKTWKEQAETVMYYALKYLDKKYNWGYQRMALFRHLMISGRAVVAHEVKNGLPCTRPVDSRFFIFDSYATDDFLTDSTYFGEIEYKPMADAAQEYNLTKEEMEQAYSKYQDFMRILSSKSSTPPRQQSLGFDSLNPASGLRWFKETPTGLRVMVFKGFWKDTKKYKVKESEDKYGNVHTKRIKPDSQDREGVVSKTYGIWRKGTLVGGCFLKDWGIMENMARDNDPDKICECEPPYTVLAPNFLNGRTVSPIERSKGLQNLKDIITYNIQLAMARSGGRGFVYDVSQCPDNWDVDTVIKYLKTVGIAFINSKQGGTPAQFNQFQQFDLSMSQSVTQFLELSNWIDSQINSVFGVNEARQGEILGSSQSVGVTRSALLQSSLTTAPYFHLFSQFTSKIWNTQAKLVKLCWEGKEKFAPIIGDAGVDFLKEDVDLDLNDYGVFVQETPTLLNDLNSFQSLVMAGLQGGQVNFEDAMMLMREKDVISGIRKFEKISKKNKKEAQEREMALQAQQAQLDTQKQIAVQTQSNQFNEQQAQQAASREMAKQQIKGEQDEKMLLLTQRFEAMMKRLEIMTEQNSQNSAK